MTILFYSIVFHLKSWKISLNLCFYASSPRKKWVLKVHLNSNNQCTLPHWHRVNFVEISIEILTCSVLVTQNYIIYNNYIYWSVFFLLNFLLYVYRPSCIWCIFLIFVMFTAIIVVYNVAIFRTLCEVLLYRKISFKTHDTAKYTPAICK